MERDLVRGQVGQATLVLNLEAAGTAARPACDRGGGEILRVGDQTRRAALRTGEHGAEGGGDLGAQRRRLVEADDVARIEFAERIFVDVMQMLWRRDLRNAGGLRRRRPQRLGSP